MRQDQASSVQIPFPYDRIRTKPGSKADGPDNFCVKPGDVILVP
jgi:hypothetical protein